MRRFFQIRNKFKICCVLIVIIVLVLLNNLRSRKHIASLDQSVSSIYQDRLLPATYLYSISNGLYQKRLMLEDKSGLPADWPQQKAATDVHIDSLIRLYDSTYLTPAEKKQWTLLKQQLRAYHRTEQAGFLTMLDSTNLTPEAKHKLNEEFKATIALLNGLENIQTGEGKLLQTGSRDIASGSVLGSQLEMALLVVLGLMALILLGMTDRHVLNADEKARLN